jgi:NAD(P)-dependent dehydrogenase (short-subunit alcohol dehydrogenase family)
MHLQEKVVVITGGTGGLGCVVTPLLSQAGATIAVVDRGPSPTAPHIQHFLAADVTNETDVARVIAEVVKMLGRLDVLINLVGGFTSGRVTETDLAVWQHMLSLNVTSAFLLSRAVIPHMSAQRSGRIIHIAAHAAVAPFPGAAAYIVSKAALVSLIRVLAQELGDTGVTVNGILPTTIDTPANRTSMPKADPSKWVRPESIAQTLIFLASTEAGQVNGALVPVG